MSRYRGGRERQELSNRGMPVRTYSDYRSNVPYSTAAKQYQESSSRYSRPSTGSGVNGSGGYGGGGYGGNSLGGSLNRSSGSMNNNNNAYSSYDNRPAVAGASASSPYNDSKSGGGYGGANGGGSSTGYGSNNAAFNANTSGGYGYPSNGNLNSSGGYGGYAGAKQNPGGIITSAGQLPKGQSFLSYRTVRCSAPFWVSLQAFLVLIWAVLYTGTLTIGFHFSQKEVVSSVDKLVVSSVNSIWPSVQATVSQADTMASFLLDGIDLGSLSFSRDPSNIAYTDAILARRFSSQVEVRRWSGLVDAGRQKTLDSDIPDAFAAPPALSRVLIANAASDMISARPGK